MLHSYIPTGIEEQLKYIKELGFDSIWLSPIYEDGGKDMGNDVKNHNKVDSKFGTDEDLQDLLKAVENEGFSILFSTIKYSVTTFTNRHESYFGLYSKSYE